jgi:hypothetical protein
LIMAMAQAFHARWGSSGVIVALAECKAQCQSLIQPITTGCWHLRK